MRLVVAVVSLMLSVLALASGILLRTVWAGADTVTETITVDHTAPALVMDGSVLTAHPGRQSITVVSEEGADTSDIILVYGRTVDVLAWLSPARFTQVSFDQVTGELRSAPRLGEQSTVPNPLGSDLWLEQYAEKQAMRVVLTAGADISVAIFSDGQRSAPGTVQISWPLNNVSPFSAPLIIIGSLMFVGGIFFLVLHVGNERRRRGPRRKTQLAPRPKRVPRAVRKPRTTSLKPRGRRAAPRVGIVLTPVLTLGLLGACVPATSPSTSGDELEEGAPQVAEAPVPYPAVTEAQFQRIMSRIARQVQLADESLDPGLIEVRMGEPALSMRRAAYLLRNSSEDLGTIVPISAGPLSLIVPQQTGEWPRVVFAVLEGNEAQETPALGVVLRQESPRDNYLLHYAVALAPDTVLPTFPAASVGAPRIARDSKLLLLSPALTVTGYGNLVEEGSASRYAGDFDTLTDSLFSLVGPDGQDLRQESFGTDLDVSLRIDEPDYLSIALQTSENGAVVFGALSEVETVRPVQEGATVNATPSARVFSGVPESPRGFNARYDMHVAWFVPPIGSDERIRVIGFSYALVDTQEIPREEASDQEETQ